MSKYSHTYTHCLQGWQTAHAFASRPFSAGNLAVDMPSVEAKKGSPAGASIPSATQGAQDEGPSAAADTGKHACMHNSMMHAVCEHACNASIYITNVSQWAVQHSIVSYVSTSSTLDLACSCSATACQALHILFLRSAIRPYMHAVLLHAAGNELTAGGAPMTATAAAAAPHTHAPRLQTYGSEQSYDSGQAGAGEPAGPKDADPASQQHDDVIMLPVPRWGHACLETMHSL